MTEIPTPVPAAAGNKRAQAPALENPRLAGEVGLIPLDQTCANPKAGRMIDANVVNGPAGSIEDVELKHPLSIIRHERRNGGKVTAFDIVVGRYHYQAHLQLKRTHIPAVIVTEGPTRLNLWTTDENLIWAGYDPGEEAKAFAEGKKINEKLHPESTPGQVRAAGMNQALGRKVGEKRARTFVQDSAAATGQCKWSTQMRTRLSERIASDVITMPNWTAFDKTVEYSVIMSLPHQKQPLAAEIALAAQVKSLREGDDRLKWRALAVAPPPKPASQANSGDAAAASGGITEGIPLAPRATASAAEPTSMPPGELKVVEQQVSPAPCSPAAPAEAGACGDLEAVERKIEARASALELVKKAVKGPHVMDARVARGQETRAVRLELIESYVKRLFVIARNVGAPELRARVLALIDQVFPPPSDRPDARSVRVGRIGEL